MEFVDALSNFENTILLGLLGGVFTSILNAMGATPVFAFKKPSQKFLDLSLGFAAGVMLAASFTSLILPGIEYGGIVPVVVGIFIGSVTISMIDVFTPHLHFISGEKTRKSRLRAVWLFFIAITIHNMPEGLSVGVGFGSGDVANAIALMVAIGAQNIPEGLSIAFSFISEGYSRIRAYTYATISGFVEVPLALIGAVVVSLVKPIIPFAMGFAAGAMIFVIADEIIPEVYRSGHERVASYGLIIGLVVMLILDVVL